MRIRTYHGTYLNIRDCKIIHELQKGDIHEEPISGILLRNYLKSKYPLFLNNAGPFSGLRIIHFGNGEVSFCEGDKFLSAQPEARQVSIDRNSIGPWERFFVELSDVDYNINVFQPVPMLNNLRGIRREIVSSATTEFLFPPVTINEDDYKWFIDSEKVFFPINPGIQNIEVNEIFEGENLFYSKRYGAHGVIFNAHGFLSNPGFLSLNKNMPEIVSTNSGFSISLGNALENEFLSGSYSFVFDGNSFNYYHWLIEGILSLLILHFNKKLYTPIVCTGPNGLISWQKEYLDLLEIKSYFIYQGREQNLSTSEFGSLWNIERGNWIKENKISHISSETILAVRDHIIRKVSQINPFNGTTRVYIKRKTRTVKNFLELDSLLLKRGFNIVYLEDMTVTDQIIMFSAADIVIGVHGAGLANIIYMKYESILIELHPASQVRNFFWILAGKVRVNYGILRCECDNDYYGDINVNIEDLNELIDKMS